MDYQKQNVMFIRAGGGFISEGNRQEGYRVEKPFYEYGLLFRIIREIWFRAGFPFKELFYNKKITDFNGEYVIVYDPQITKHYLEWLQRQKKWKIIFFYGNMVGRARHLKPNEIPDGISKWTYEPHDSEEYGLKYNNRICYHTCFRREKKEKEYDVLFVGRDKGRIEFLSRLEKELQKNGLSTFFRIVGNTRFEKKRDKRYGPEMSYEEISELISKSSAILNVVLPEQEGITVRDAEAIFNNVKLITTNKKIVEKDYYNPNNILVIEEIEVAQIKSFLKVPFVPYSKELQDSLTLDNWVKLMLD